MPEAPAKNSNFHSLQRQNPVHAAAALVTYHAHTLINLTSTSIFAEAGGHHCGRHCHCFQLSQHIQDGNNMCIHDDGGYLARASLL